MYAVSEGEVIAVVLAHVETMLKTLFNGDVELGKRTLGKIAPLVAVRASEPVPGSCAAAWLAVHWRHIARSADGLDRHGRGAGKALLRGGRLEYSLMPFEPAIKSRDTVD